MAQAPSPANASSWVVRPVRATDIGVLVELAEALGAGMTTFPADPEAIARKVEASLTTFAGRAEPEDARYLLVLEDLDASRVDGVAALYPSVGWPYGFFSYKVNRLVQRSRSLNRRVDIELLTIANDYTGVTEVGTLAVRPTLRGTGAARFLARSRYMLIAAFPQLFATRVMAEMRGWQEADDRSPFWDAVGARFFHMDFAEADRLSAVEGAEFIAELMPKHPIYTDILPDDARRAIGRPHASSAAAMAMLLDEGFRYEQHVDVFDAGPQVHAERDRIHTVADSRLTRLQRASGRTGQPVLVSTLELEAFRVVQTSAHPGDHVLELPDVAQRALELSIGGPVRVSPTRAHAGRVDAPRQAQG